MAVGGAGVVSWYSLYWHLVLVLAAGGVGSWLCWQLVVLALETGVVGVSVNSCCCWFCWCWCWCLDHFFMEIR